MHLTFILRKTLHKDCIENEQQKFGLSLLDLMQKGQRLRYEDIVERLFSDIEIREIRKHINIKQYQHDPLTRTEILNAEKQDSQPEIESNILITETPTTTKQILTQKDIINVEFIEKIMAENKTTFLFIRKQNWKKQR